MTAELEQGLHFFRQFNYAQAEGCFRQTLEHDPKNSQALFHLGLIVKNQGKLHEALTYFQNTIVHDRQIYQAYFELANILKQLGYVEQTLDTYQEALKYFPQEADLYCAMASSYELLGEYERALAYYDQALALRPSSATEIKKAFTLPLVLETPEKVTETYQTLQDKLEQLGHKDLHLTDPFLEVGQLPFYSIYYGFNDLPTHQKLYQLFQKACPDLKFQSRKKNKSNFQPKIGFLSRFVSTNQTIAKLMQGVVSQVNRQQFEVKLFPLGVENNDLSPFLHCTPEEIISLPLDFFAARQRIADEELDVLFFLDVAMDPLSYFLAYGRMAPVQCTSWGHGITSGLPTVDYFLSSQALETPNSQTVYAEKLICFENLLPYYYYPPAPKNKQRASMGLEEDKHLYICPQSLVKLHPVFDETLKAILREDAEAQLVLIAESSQTVVSLLWNRWKQVMPEQLEQIIFVPYQDYQGFIDLLSLCDVMLDPFPFGGGNTSYEAFSVGLPIVTLPTPFLKGRITYALYQQMGVNDLIVANSRDYIHKTLALGQDVAYRNHVSQRILAHRMKIFENRSGVEELENWVLSLQRNGEI